MLSGVSHPCEGSKILTFLFRPRLVCSSLIHLRSSWKVNSARTTSPCAPSPKFRIGPVLCGRVSYGVSEIGCTAYIYSVRSWLPTLKNAAKNKKYLGKKMPRPSKFIADSSPLGNKTRGKHVTQSNTEASSIYGQI